MAKAQLLHILLVMQSVVIHGLRNEIKEVATRSVEVSAPGSIAKSMIAANRSEGDSATVEDLDEESTTSMASVMQTKETRMPSVMQSILSLVSFSGDMEVAIKRLTEAGAQELDHLLIGNDVLRRLQGAVLDFQALVGAFPKKGYGRKAYSKQAYAEQGRKRIKEHVELQQNAFVEAAKAGTIKGTRLLGKDLHMSKAPNMGDTLPRANFKEDFDIGTALWLSPLEKINECLSEMPQESGITVMAKLSTLVQSEMLKIFELDPSDKRTFNKALEKIQKADAKEAYGALKKASSENEANSMIAFLHWLDRSRGMERILIEVFERKGFSDIDLLSRDVCYIGMAIGGIVLDMINKERKWQGKDLIGGKPGEKTKYSLSQFLSSSIQQSVGNLMGDVSLSFRYEGFYLMVEASRSSDHGEKLQKYSQVVECYVGSAGANSNALQISQPAFAPAETLSRMNGIYQVTEMWYQLDHLLAEDFGAKYKRQFSSKTSTENRIFLMRMLAGMRWMTGDMWGMTDTLRRLPKPQLELEKLKSGDKVVDKRYVAEQIRLKQSLLTSLRGCPNSDPYHMYPGFMPGITLLEFFDELTQILHLTKEKVKIAFRKDGASEMMELGFQEVACITDILRKFLDTHGKPGLWEKGIEVSDAKSMDIAATFLLKTSGHGKWEPEGGSFEAKTVPDPEKKVTMKRGLVPRADESNFLYLVAMGKTQIYEWGMKALELLLRKLTGKETPMWTTDPMQVQQSLDDSSGKETNAWRTIWDLAGLAKPFTDYAKPFGETVWQDRSSENLRKEEAWQSTRYADELHKFHADEGQTAVHDMISLQKEAWLNIAEAWVNVQS